MLSSCGNKAVQHVSKIDSANISIPKTDSVKNDYEIIIASFLGDEKRCYYGEDPPAKLDILWKCWLGGAPSHMPFNDAGTNMRYGAGWTGQPLLFKEKGNLCLIQGSYDFHLRKIYAETGDILWKYSFGDAIKGTGTLYLNKNSGNEENRLAVLQGSRQPYGLEYNYRSVSAVTGEELFRMRIERTRSNSRDVDGSALIINDTAYLGLENGIFTVFNPNDEYAYKNGKFYEPEIYSETNLFSNNDIAKRGGNIITESSPAYLNGKVYVAAGSGYVYGYNISKGEIDWEFYIGSDLNGSVTVTDDNCLLVPVEKQFIAGNGGMLKLNPYANEGEEIEWYFPVGNKNLLSWNGGVIGSAAINDKYKMKGQPSLAAFSGIDGYLYVVNYKSKDGTVKNFDGKTIVNTPELVFKYKTGASISTPVLFQDKLIAAGYGGIFLFSFDSEFNFTLLDKKPYTFEATPVAYGGKVFIASKDGWLYCFGEK